MYKQANHHSSSEWDDDVLLQEEEDRPHNNLNIPPPHRGQTQHQQAYYQQQQQRHSHNLTATSRSDPSHIIPLDQDNSHIHSQGVHNVRSPPSLFSPPGGYNISSLPHQRYDDHHHARIHSPEDEPEDVLVWNTTTGQSSHHSTQSHHHNNSRPQTNFNRSHSDTDEADNNRPSLRKSKSIKSLGGGPSKTAQTEDMMTLSNGNFISEEYENHMVAVTKQLEQIKTTQDSILSELSDDMSNLQFENVQLKNTNEHLTMQNSHLLQVITDLSNEVEHMRGVFRVRGWPIKEISPPETKSHKVIASIAAKLGGEIESPDLEINTISRKSSNKTDPDPDEEEAATEPQKRRHHQHHRRRSGSGGSHSSSHSSSRKHLEPSAKFETISLSDDPPRVKQRHQHQQNREDTQPGPGDDQVAAMAQRPHGSGSSGGKGKKSSTKTKLATISSDSMGERRGRGSSTSNNSKQNLKKGASNSETGGGGSSCFKKFFKRNKKRSSNAIASCSDQLD